MTELIPSSLKALAVLIMQFLNSTPIEPEEATASASSKPHAQTIFKSAAEALEGNERFWTAPYVIADLQQKEVLVWGQHTGMNVGDPLEFFVISEMSGHDYESLMISYAAPSDIHRALEKIGLQPGTPVHPDAYEFWPRGDRVSATILWKPEGEKAPVEMAVEKTAIENEKVMKPEPWVFTGAPTLPSRVNEGETVYGADEFSPNSIASTFNLRNTVFDLPRQGSKTQTYGTFLRNPQLKAPDGTPMILRLRPAVKGTYPEALDFSLHLSAGNPEVKIEGDNAPEAENLEELGAALNQRLNQEHFLRVVFDESLTLTDLSTLARKIQLIEQHVNTVRVSPPRPGRLYYQAFIPDPAYRNRAKRPSQPIELHLREINGNWSATVMELTEVWNEGRTPDIVEKRVDVSTPADWQAYLKKREEKNPVLFLYAAGDTPHSTLLEWVSPVLEQFPIIFVYQFAAESE